jgi:hypothetical protein
VTSYPKVPQTAARVVGVVTVVSPSPAPESPPQLTTGISFTIGPHPISGVRASLRFHGVLSAPPVCVVVTHRTLWREVNVPRLFARQNSLSGQGGRSRGPSPGTLWPEEVQ